MYYKMTEEDRKQFKYDELKSELAQEEMMDMLGAEQEEVEE